MVWLEIWATERCRDPCGPWQQSEFGKGSDWEIFEGGSYLIYVFKGLLGVL